jgi:hypothetical protein
MRLGRDLLLEQGDVEGVSLIAFDVSNAGSTINLFCGWCFVLLLLLSVFAS